MGEKKSKCNMKINKKENNEFGADWLNANINLHNINLDKVRKSTPTIEKEINQYITLKLEGGRTYIYVNGKRFLQCIRLILNIPKSDLHLYDEIDSIDEAAKLYSKHVFQNRIVRGPMAAPVPNQMHDITPEQEFWGHCSNIQAWVEHNYDTRILMSNISFPLLRELTRAGDPVASKIFKEEIALRLESGYPSVVEYLLNQGYLRYFTPSEFKTVIESTELIKGLSSNPKMLSRFLLSSIIKFPTVVEAILIQILKVPKGKKHIISSMSSSITHRMPFLRYTYRSNPQYLLTLKNALENLFKEADEKTGEDILDCIQAIEDKLIGQEIYLPKISRRDKFEAFRDLIFDKKVFEHLGADAQLQFTR
ncbi:MAG: hypothetical protein R3255_09115, partial [Candidatus Lokiarchaeia archaeon]|nr:hypothetical protein [Candidatus Lokiarchaeia archaeon]